MQPVIDLTRFQLPQDNATDGDARRPGEEDDDIPDMSVLVAEFDALVASQEETYSEVMGVLEELQAALSREPVGASARRASDDLSGGLSAGTRRHSLQQ